jgi:ATP-dependent RNA helicase SUPV3L1/SUV3
MEQRPDPDLEPDGSEPSRQPAPARQVRKVSPMTIQSRVRQLATEAGRDVSVRPGIRMVSGVLPWRWSVRRDRMVGIPSGARGAIRSRFVRFELDLGDIPEVEEIARAPKMVMKTAGRRALDTIAQTVATRTADLDERVDRAVERFRAETEEIAEGLDERSRKEMFKELRGGVSDAIEIASTPERADLDLLVALRERRGRTAAMAADVALSIGRVRARAGFDDYVGRFPLARALSREFVLHVGPTNSGKTHAAMQELKLAPTGVYLAPLRLLALEGREILESLGVAAGMLTGEERDVPEGTTHLSQTIETAAIDRPVDTAVIDEVQMLADRDRGWAWSQALFGIPARKVVLCGSPESVPLVQRALALTGEKLSVVQFERKNELVALDQPLRWEDVARGDALIAFSRRALFAIRERAVGLGHSVATVYGALAPDVRRAEAARFRAGEADLLIATDAIGMGLNFGPLKRVVFTALAKFDGVDQRHLADHEIRQIAGRAGRFGHAERGFVGTLLPLAPGAVRAALARAPAPPPEAFRFPVRPDRTTIEIAVEETGMADLARILSALAERLTEDSSPFSPSGLEAMTQMARLLDHIDLPVGVKFDFASAPLDVEEHADVACLISWARAMAEGRTAKLPRPPGRTRSLQDLEGDVKRISAYLWLARKYPGTFLEVDEAATRRRAVNAAIEDSLVRSARSRSRREAETEAT